MFPKVSNSHRSACAATVAMILSFASSAAGAGIADSPLPVFSAAKSSELVLTVPAVVDRAGTATIFLRSSVDSAPVNVGAQVFAAAGVLRNDVTAGQGAGLTGPRQRRSRTSINREGLRDETVAISDSDVFGQLRSRPARAALCFSLRLCASPARSNRMCSARTCS